MCIRDRLDLGQRGIHGLRVETLAAGEERVLVAEVAMVRACLLYTSDAADERSSVDLGGRRIIKKKKQEKQCGATGSTHGTPEAQA